MIVDSLVNISQTFSFASEIFSAVIFIAVLIVCQFLFQRCLVHKVSQSSAVSGTFSPDCTA